MRSIQTVLRITALAFLAFGIYGLFFPERMLGPSGVMLPVPAARGEMRAFYGGFEIGFGLFLLMAAFRPRLAEGAALAACLGLSGIALARVLSMLLEGFFNPAFGLSALVEIVGAAANYWAYTQAAPHARGNR
ncbi:MAG: DUF4345 domain-containing protein [Proteobacteria bacterium]|nr:MAG: DUF4345 domain-containing protein [Pseudomonadota bacterium]